MAFEKTLQLQVGRFSRGKMVQQHGTVSGVEAGVSLKNSLGRDIINKTLLNVRSENNDHLL
jgi:hypothetical protein